MEITLTATAEEFAFTLNVLGQLPTQSNAWPLFQKLKTQFDAQAAKNAPESAEAPAQPAQAQDAA